MTATHTPHTPGSRRWVFWIFLALAVFYLGVEHRALLAGTLRWLPLVILLLCPLMHVFMHRGHGGHGRTGPDDSSHVGHENRRKADRPDGSPMLQREDADMPGSEHGYGLWMLAAINAAFFLFSAWSFYKPMTRSAATRRIAAPMVGGMLSSTA